MRAESRGWFRGHLQRKGLCGHSRVRAHGVHPVQRRDELVAVWRGFTRALCAELESLHRRRNGRIRKGADRERGSGPILRHPPKHRKMEGVTSVRDVCEMVYRKQECSRSHPLLLPFQVNSCSLLVSDSPLSPKLGPPTVLLSLLPLGSL